MDAEMFVKLLEEMIDLKVQKATQANVKTSPESTPVLQAKLDTDRHRLDQIRVELVRQLG